MNIPVMVQGVRLCWPRSTFGADRITDTASSSDITAIAAAGLTAIVLYLLGLMLFHLLGLPAPVAMLFLAVAAKLGSAVSPRLHSGGLVSVGLSGSA